MSKYNPAADELSNLLNNGVWNRAIHPIIKEKITRVLEGVKITDNLITEKEQAVKQKEHLLVQKESVIKEKDTELLDTKQIAKKQGLKLEWQEGQTSNLFNTPFDLTRDTILLQTRLKADIVQDIQSNDHGEHGIEFRNKQIQDYDQIILKLNKELVDEASRVKGEAITKSDHLRADILVQEAWKTDAEWYRREAIKNNDHGEHGIEFRNKQIQDCDQTILKLNKELVDEASRVKGEAITRSDHLRADILIKEAWKTDAEWHRREAVKNNDHGEYGIEFRNKQRIGCDQEIYRLIKELIGEANRVKSEAITKSDHLKADILIQEAWKTDAEWCRREVVKYNYHGEHGIEFRNRQLPEYDKEISRLVKELIDEASRIKGEAITPLDHLKADILVQEAWKTDAEWHRREAVKNNDHGEYGIEFRNKQLPEYDKEINRLTKELKSFEINKEQEIDKFKELLSIREHELQEKQELLLAKELEKQELLAQKENEIHNKSMVKNQFINELQGELGLKEKEALNLKIESLMKQVEFHKKESELKDKVLEDALEIGKQNKIISELKEKELADVLEIVKQKDVINELQGKLLDLKALYEHDISFSEQFSAIQFRAENSIANNDIADIQYLIGHIGGLVEDGRENIELVLNESPIPQVHENNAQENVVQNPLAVINNFDINHINTTHSVYPSGEGSSFSIIQEESLN